MNINKWNDSYLDRKVKVIGTRSGSGLLMGKTYYIIGEGPNSSDPRLKVRVSSKKGGAQCHGWCFLEELKFFEITKEILEIEIKNLEDEIASIEAAIREKDATLDFLEDNGLKSTDEETLKTYRIMKRLNIGSLEDAKAITKILNG